MLCSMSALILLLLLQAELAPADLSTISGALRDKRFAAAVALTHQRLAKDGQDPRIWTLQGLAHAGLNQPSEALKDFRQAVALAPDYLPALKAEAQLEYATHDGQSLTTLNRIIALEPGDAVSHAMLGSLAYQRQDCDGVVTNYAASERLIEAQAAALTEYGQCLFQRGQTPQATRAFEKVVALDSHSWQARYNLAVANLLSNRAGEALQVMQPALDSRDAPPSQVLDLAASAYEQMGDTPRAVSTLRQAILNDPINSALYLHFADLSLAHNSFQAGISMLNAGFQKLPNSAPLHLARGVLYVQLGQYEKAEDDFAQATQLDSTQAFSSVAQGLTQLQRSNVDGALAIIREQLQQNPKDGYLHYLKAEALRQKGAEPGTAAFEEALLAAETAVRLKPRFPLAEDLLGTFYLRQNHLEMARQQFEKVLQSEPNNESALYHLIVASRKSGRVTELPGLMKRLSEAKALQKNLERSSTSNRRANISWIP
jgi:tetratricopeptide (TPR) repeat protein